MKRFYSRFRIMLMTFALGLASVFVFNGSLKYSDEMLVNLPKAESSNLIIVYTADEKCYNYIIRGSMDYCVKKKD